MRVAMQAFAAVLGGAQSIHTNSLDETWALPTEEAVTVALRTQQIIANETGQTASSIRSPAATMSSGSPTRSSGARASSSRRSTRSAGC